MGKSPQEPLTYYRTELCKKEIMSRHIYFTLFTIKYNWIISGCYYTAYSKYDDNWSNARHPVTLFVLTAGEVCTKFYKQFCYEQNLLRYFIFCKVEHTCQVRSGQVKNLESQLLDKTSNS